MMGLLEVNKESAVIKLSSSKRVQFTKCNPYWSQESGGTDEHKFNQD